MNNFLVRLLELLLNLQVYFDGINTIRKPRLRHILTAYMRKLDGTMKKLCNVTLTT